MMTMVEENGEWVEKEVTCPICEGTGKCTTCGGKGTY
jgi:hypothetical protein